MHVWITYTVYLHKDKSSASKGQLRDFPGGPVVDLTSQCMIEVSQKEKDKYYILIHIYGI